MERRFVNKELLISELTRILVDEFEIPESDIVPDANLYQDLDLDSIDAIDLVVKLQNLTDTKLDAESFKKVRTISDVINELEKIMA